MHPARRSHASQPLTACLAAVCLLAAAHDDSAPGHARSAARTLVLGVRQEPDLLDPIVSRMRSASYVGQMIFSYFARTDPTGRLVPDLLEAIPDRRNGGLSADGRTIVYHLRRDARWHDGRPLTSADVRATYDRIIDPDSGAANRHGWEGVEGVETPDPWTVVFKLDRARPAFIADAFVDEPVLPAHLIGDLAGSAFRESPFHRRPIGSGPFQLESWASGDHLTLRAFPRHHGGAPPLDRIVLRFVPDAAGIEAQLVTGEIDGADNLEPTSIAAVERIPRIALQRTAGTSYEHLDLNCEHPPLDDVRVRRAIALAIDRSEISRVVYEERWPAAWGDEPPGSRYYEPRVRAVADHDPRQAARLLDEAGWTAATATGRRARAGTMLSLTLVTPGGRPDREQTALLIRDQLARVGIALEIRLVEPTVFFSSAEDAGTLQRGDFDLALFAWNAPPDPSVKEAMYGADAVPPQGQNVSRLRDAAVSALLRRGAIETDDVARLSLYREAALRIAALAPSVPLVWRTQIDAVPSALRNFRPNPTPSGNAWNVAEWTLDPGR